MILLGGKGAEEESLGGGEQEGGLMPAFLYVVKHITHGCCFWGKSRSKLE